jgi:hypothetical protein
MHTWVAGLPLSGALPEDLRQLCYKVMDKIIPALSSSKDIQFVAGLFIFIYFLSSLGKSYLLITYLAPTLSLSLNETFYL